MIGGKKRWGSERRRERCNSTKERKLVEVFKRRNVKRESNVEDDVDDGDQYLRQIQLASHSVFEIMIISIIIHITWI